MKKIIFGIIVLSSFSVFASEYSMEQAIRYNNCIKLSTPEHISAVCKDAHLSDADVLADLAASQQRAEDVGAIKVSQVQKVKTLGSQRDALVQAYNDSCNFLWRERAVPKCNESLNQKRQTLDEAINQNEMFDEKLTSLRIQFESLSYQYDRSCFHADRMHWCNTDLESKKDAVKKLIQIRLKEVPYEMPPEQGYDI